jgi:hypothetical protein
MTELHWKLLKFKIDDDTVTGTYAYDPVEEIVHVRSVHGSKSTQRGGSTPEALARLLLRELERERKTPL